MNNKNITKHSNPGKYKVVGPGPCRCNVCRNCYIGPSPHKAGLCPYVNGERDAPRQYLYAMNEQSPYVRYHEIGNRPEKSLGTGSFTWDPGDDDKPMTMSINDASWDEVMKILAKCATDTVNYKNPKETKDMSYPDVTAKCNETHGLIKTLEGLAKESPENAQIMKQIAENAEKKYKERVEKALAGSADLELLKGPRGKRFVLKHFYGSKEHTVYGTAYPGYDADEETTGTFNKQTVCLQPNGDPIVYNNYLIINRLYKSLDNNNAPYVIKFFD